VKRSLWLFLAKLAGVSLVLGYLWFIGWQTAYPHWITPIADPLFRLFGVTKWLLSVTLHHFTNIIPYLALVLATPGHVKAWKRGILALFGGTAVIVLGHILMSTAIFYIWQAHGFGKTAYRYIVPVYLINDALPLVLWIVFYSDKLREILPKGLFSSGRDGTD